MLLTSLLATLLSTVPTTLSAPVTVPVTLDNYPYQCGYARTRWNSSVIAGLSAWGTCTPFFWNATIVDYQDAFAYGIYGGCACRFYLNEEDCKGEVDVPVYTEPTPRWSDPFFDDPKPKWYDCDRME
ncbi:hypothetical protein P153DRAFT_430016 [Dothidotthia symphoricarpi CBS 119687]|uniref:Uncharacterized protein n=1 Tax=Dothidotthia symphoricarpi CBS 119687 TaxID=1392245 RepID=A0A6A6AJ21_9PLEO|nr:uncharacterized protein P153DRAFT_430016 [Dothidotthia symphoricarpi CBS 119687]KAF2131800.1 hypothetical protein P153DRAFT_430016 [Dothidotthia symphoricarpi CBS 119687]